MKLLKTLTAVAIGCCFMLSANVEEIIVDRESDDELIVLEIDPNDNFLTILEWIRDMNKTGQQIREENQMMAASDFAWGEELTLEISFLDKITVSKGSKKYVNRNYLSALTAKERSDVGYIVKTLHEHNFLTIVPYRSSLKKAGERVDHLHPFRFLEAIFTDEELKKCVRNIQGKTFVWGEFLNGVVTSFKDETKKNNVLPEHLADFCAILGIDISTIYQSYVEQKWEHMVDILISVVPVKATNTDGIIFNI